MGNTLIQDSATGNIMGLSPGFIPIGMKEHGGIMYITSVDKDGNGEIGTIPSPIIRDVYKAKTTLTIKQTIPIDNDAPPVEISNKLYPADKFIANLSMSMINENDIKGASVLYKNSSELLNKDKDPSDFILKRTVAIKGGTDVKPLYTPLISYAPDYNKEEEPISIAGTPNKVPLFSTKGIYKMSLFSTNTNGQKVEDSLMNRQIYDAGQQSEYWFLHTDEVSDIFPKDLLTATLNQGLKQFPSSNKPGKLCVKLETEKVGTFGILPRYDELKVPITFKEWVEGQPKYTSYFPGFYYYTDNGLYINKLANIQLIDESVVDSSPVVNSNEINFPNFIFNKDNKGWETVLSTCQYDSQFNIDRWWDEGNLPQTQSESDPNIFILSNIASITDHKKTNLKSSTEGQDASPHTGVLTLNWTENSSPKAYPIDHWYRLEFDYFDQYDEKQGTFSTRFNPYINDTFGTNLSVDKVQMGESLVMGVQQQLKREYNIGLESHTPHTFGCSGPRVGTTADQMFTDWSNQYYTDGTSCTFYPKTKNLNFYIRSKILITDCSMWPYCYKSIPDPSTLTPYDNTYKHQFYSRLGNLKIDFPKSNYECIVLGGNQNINNKFYDISSSTSRPDGWTYPFNQRANRTTVPTIVMESFTFGDKENNFGIGDDGWIISVNQQDNYEITTAKSITCPEYVGSIALTQFDYVANEANYGITLDNISGKCGPLYQLDGEKIGNNSKYGSTDVTKRWGYSTGNFGENTEDFDFEITVTPTTKYTTEFYNYTEFMPSYSITPYFLLRGTNDNGEKVYVQRFGKIGNTDIVYEHNFEQYNGETKNYIIQNEDTSFKQSAEPCSYNHQHPFYYEDTDFTYHQSLKAGIYVLNIQRCPGVDFSIINGKTNDKLVNLEIIINGETYSYQNDQIPYWIIPVNYDNKITINNSGVEINGAEISDAQSTQLTERLYRPLVLVLQSDSDVKINISAISKSFIRQSVGLFKIKNVNVESLRELPDGLKHTLVVSYHKYMRDIQKHSQTITNTIEQYQYMQKYGAFFKEGYVFIDGLIDGYIDAQKTISHISIGENDYLSVPYIPQDPSILPISVCYDENGDEIYIWNAYVIPKAYIDNPDNDTYNKFIFSNTMDNYQPKVSDLRTTINSSEL